MSKKKNQVKVSFVGNNAQDVTGSMTLIETNNYTILLECGLYQSNDIKHDYEINSSNFRFKAKNIDFVFLNHIHIDHSGLIPKLYNHGCKAEIITVKDSKNLLEVLLKDSAHIMCRDVEALQRLTGKNYNPIYEVDDVDTAMEHVIEYDYGSINRLNDEISFQWIPSGHIIRAAQLILYIKQGNSVKKIVYTSDLGNIKIDKYYTEPFQAIEKANLVIGECTYANTEKSTKPKDRNKDLEKIKSVVLETCYDKKGRVLIPVFALDRTQNMLTHLYQLFGEDKDFDIPVVLDSPLSCKITELYREILTGDDKELFERVLKWKNLKMITDSVDSKACVGDNTPKIILSSSGMMTSGRVKHYVKSILPDKKSCILFVGFSAVGSLAYKIKNSNEQHTISIDNKPYANNCSIVNLHSFSSHMQYDDLMKYYSDFHCEKIALVHGNFSDKILFAEALQNEISRKNRTSKVVCVNKSTEINL